jgi:hypothetical protein
MEVLVTILKEKGYPVEVDSGGGTGAPSRVTPVREELLRLSSLSRDVEAASTELHRLSSSAEFDDLVSNGALEKKMRMLEAIQGRVAAILQGKDRMLAFLQKQHARGGQVLPVHAAHQESAQDLFRVMFEHMESMDKCLAAMAWGNSKGATESRLQFEAALSSMTNWQAQYSRALEVSETFTSLLDK